MTLREGVRRLRADDPETGWLVRIVLSALLTWAFLTAGPASPGVRPVLAAALAGWFLFVFTDHRRPLLARPALALAAVLPAIAASRPEDASSLLYLYAALFTFVLLPRMPMWAILSLTAVVLAVLLTGLWLAGRGPAAMLTQPALIAVLVLFSLHRREYRLRAEQTALLLEQTTRARAAQARAAALDERARIARELHDVLAHSLGALGVQLEVAEAQLTEKGDTEAAAARIRQARRLAADGLAEARSAVRALRDDVPPLPEALTGLIDAHEVAHDAAVTLGIEGDRRPLSPGAEVSLLRIAREALTNAARHAPARPVTMTLGYLPAGGARLVVSNPATGDPSPGGLGLVGARERVALIGGTLEAGIVDGEWVVTAEVPA
ncbi:histidine kinase [Actinoplanes sp. NPDC023714]|uniref:sensor histidine kinase n=1 Tax=Actinoplanes sp. NPDC023714 TaxID=3154322 RepID=UPI0033FFDD3A